MDDNTKQFLIRVGIIAAIVFAFYWWFSPYRHCVRTYGDDIAMMCAEKTTW